jgi:MFS family permease
MQGLEKNKYQFALLVLVNAFVGAMLGLERSIMPGFGMLEFGLSANAALMSFIIAFGISKSLSNYAVAQLSKKFTRKKILIIGWVVALPVPFLLMYAPSWNWVIAANILLGINQGLAWSATVIMKIDLVGSKNRGLAMGINEFAGYLSVGLAAWLASSIAAVYGYAFFPFIPGVLFAFAVLLIQRGFGITQIGIIAAIYPAVWGISQLFTGKMGDSYCKKQLITAGMLLQAPAILMLAIASALPLLILASILLGFGTALVYPNFLSVIAESTHPKQRAESLSIFRLWRDSGYVFGALLSGVLADAFGITYALFIVAGITAIAGIIANKRMCCTAKTFWKSEYCVPVY